MMIVNKIGDLARQRDLNVQELARKAKVSYGTAHGLYTGVSKRIDLEVLDKMCAALGVQPGDLFVRVETK